MKTKILKNNKKASLEFENLGKIILMAVFLIVLILIVGVLLKDKLADQLVKIISVFNKFG